MSNSKRYILFRTTGAEIKTAVYMEKEHVVVPVVALMEGVIHAVNSPSPELVLADELEIAPDGWNGRPVVGDHPMRGNERVSANIPEVMEKEAFGILFNARMEDKKLKVEAWLDPERAEKVGPEAVSVLERAKNQELIEVSVGAYVTTEAKTGTYKGKQYKGVWRSLVPDHLAMLPEGTIGACSVEMGCGAPRAAEQGGTMGDEKKSVWEKIKGLMRTSQDESDVELRAKLDTALQMEEPGYLGIEAVFPGDSKVIFATAPGDIFGLFQRTFTDKEGELTLNNDKIEVTQVTKYEPINAEAGGQEKMVDEKIAKRVTALIDCPRTPFTCDDRAFLEGLSEEKLSGFEKGWPEPKPEPTSQKVTEPEPEPVHAELTEEQILELPNASGIKKDLEEFRAARKNKKDELIKKLVAAQKIYTEEMLNGMSTEELERIGALVKVDYSGKGNPRAAEGEEGVPPAPSIADRLKAKAS